MSPLTNRDDHRPTSASVSVSRRESRSARVPVRHRGQGADLEEVPVDAVRQLRELPERGLVQVDRLGVREDAGGGLGGAMVVLERPRAVSGAGVLVGQLCGHLVGAARVQELQCLRQPTVQEPARRRTHLLVRRVAQQVVGEVVAAAGLVQDP
jgi:hypothetical protein